MSQHNKRTPPTPLALICIFGAIGVLTSPFTLFKEPWTSSLGAWSLPYLVFHEVLLAVALIGLWTMKRWGLILYAASIVESQVFLIANGHWSWVSVVFFSLLLAIPLYYREDMT